MSPKRNFMAYLRPILKILAVWVVIILMIALGIELGVDKKIIGVAVGIFGFLTHAFSGLMTIIALIPIAGPLIVKVISLPVFWIINGLGYILSAFAVKQGFSKEILNYRVLTIVFLLGVVIGFIIGSII
jgi:hypothetical protein